MTRSGSILLFCSDEKFSLCCTIDSADLKVFVAIKKRENKLLKADKKI